MTLLAVGRGLRTSALKGLNKVADLEAQQNIKEDQLEAAEKAQEMSSLGMGGSIGAMYGLRNLDAAKSAVDAGSQGLSNLSVFKESAQVVPGSVEAALAPPPGVIEAAEGVKAGSDLATAANTTGAASSGLGTLVTPIAIGLGVAFLLNKLFD